MKIAFRCLPIALAALFATPIARAEGAADLKPTEQPPFAAASSCQREETASLRRVPLRVDADIAPEKKALHATFDLGFAVYWGL